MAPKKSSRPKTATDKFPGRRVKTTAALSASARKPAISKLPAPKTVDEYFDRLSEPALTALHKMRDAIRSVLPKEATETISYSIPAFKLKKIVVWYAAFASHCSLFPTNAVLEQFKNDMKGFITSKGTVQFPLDKPLPLPLIKNLVKARVEQVIAGKK